MKRILSLFLISLCIIGCGSKQSHESRTNSSPSNKTISSSSAYSLDSLLASIDQLVNKQVTVKGVVTHTCKHAGKRCFIVGKNKNATMRIEAGGSIGGFNRELVGSELIICGVIKENRLTKEYIKQAEEQLRDGSLQENGSAESCEAELNNLNEMKEWMKANNKNYYSVYYMEGIDYEVATK